MIPEIVLPGSTDVGDVAKFIKDGENGYIVPIKDVSTLVKKAGVLIENSDLREKLGINARKIAVKNLDVEIFDNDIRIQIQEGEFVLRTPSYKRLIFIISLIL